MSTEPTPGPWLARPVFGKEGLAIFVIDKSKPGVRQKRLDDRSGVFSEADARRIVAAPKMLEALFQAEAALGENLTWLSDKLDLHVRQKDQETIRKLAQLDAAWKAICGVLDQTKGTQK